MRCGVSCVLVLGLSLSMSAESSAAQGTQPASQPDSSKEQVLEGCLRETRADTTTASRQGVIYTLDVTPGAANPTDRESSAARAAAVAKTRYALSFDDAIDAAKHAGHHVQVTGHLLPRPAKDEKEKAEKPLPGAAQQMLHVTALKMIAATCP